VNKVQEIINSLQSNRFSIRDLEQYLGSPILLIKVNAIIAVLRERISDENIIFKLNCIAQNIQHEPKVIGEWNTGHYAMAVLDLLNTVDTRDMYDNNMNKLDAYTQRGVEMLSEQIACELKIDK